jgi:hypothetical protein
MRLSDIIDKDMVYKNNLEEESWVFDVEGEWTPEAENHPELTLEKNFQEIEYYRQK